jgi:uncharacterized circularly permuted ATP-grasp superfamily protein
VRFERALPGTNEVFFPDGTLRPVYETVFDELRRTGPERWREKLRRAHGLLLDEQYAFGIKEGDKTHPTDWIPRIVPASDWGRLEAGLTQRLRAINVFLERLEAGKEEVVPREVVESSILYDTGWKDRFGPVPVRQIAFDVVAVESGRTGQTGGWEYLVIEENAKMPVGLAAMTRRRRMSGEVFFPESLQVLPVCPLDGWLERLGQALRAASPRGPEATLAVVSSGPDDQFYLDHHIYAREMDAILAETKDLRVDGHLIHRPTGRTIDVIYERVDEDRLYAEVPGLLECHVERQDLVARAGGRQALRHGPLRRAGHKKPGRLRGQGGHDRARGVQRVGREVPRDGGGKPHRVRGPGNDRLLDPRPLRDGGR